MYDWPTALGIDEAKEKMGGLIEPNEDEKRNGWTAKTLTIYLAERKGVELDVLFPKPKKPKRTASRMKWLLR